MESFIKLKNFSGWPLHGRELLQRRNTDVYNMRICHLSTQAANLNRLSMSRNLATNSARVYVDYDISTPPPHPGNAWTRFVCISDTHSRVFSVPDGDVLLHSGDLSSWGHPEQLEVTLAWLRKLPHSQKVCAFLVPTGWPPLQTLTLTCSSSSESSLETTMYASSPISYMRRPKNNVKAMSGRQSFRG
jgi:hypothetical protein